ncbi:ATP-binding cassette subfamily B protein [Streptomyces sp. Ag109_G2-6]|uniref:ABC transporter ATP-binding protein n=1 Tax=Streptomyces TaxID=1883 RepID=UPI000FA833A1|nr:MULTISPECIES: ABC transporter ATP-binding protein [Streptomyces]RPF29867.1 ATP-binding cassette subfamily B protein [Streptomyces sp. Ag109_G2-6]
MTSKDGNRDGNSDGDGDGDGQERVQEELAFAFERDSRWEATKLITLRHMARRLPHLLTRSLSVAWRVDRRSVVVLMACQAVSGAAAATGLLATTSTITALISSGDITGRLWDAWPSVAVLAAAAGLRAGLYIVVTWLSSRLAPLMQQECELMLLDAATTSELAAYDSPGFKDRWDNAERGAVVAKDIIEEGQELIAALASLLAGAFVLGALHPVLIPFLVLAGIPQGIAQIHSARVTYTAGVRMTGHSRMLGVLRWHLSDSHAADQIRAGTMAPFLLGTYRRITGRVTEVHRQAVTDGARMAFLGALGGGAASALVWGVLVALLATGHLSVAAAGTAVLALRTVTGSVQGVVRMSAVIFRTGMYMDDWSRFLEETGGYRLKAGEVVPGAPGEVRAEKLVYRYEGSERNALDGIDFSVRRGEIVALVGENGSGKTTLSNLLTRLHLPTAGTVTWDGHPTTALDPHAAWKQVAMVPQRYACWPLTARDNITLGQPAGGDGRDGDEAGVWEACRATGADEVVAELRSGLGTLLAREWLGGTDLSGGQWQRIALARAFYRPAGLLVLDEPTSALDPRAEHRIFTHLRRAARDRAVVLVTHRLTNVAVADRIVVLDHGRVVQQGTYGELSTAPGLFRELLALQHDRDGAIPSQRAAAAAPGEP